MNAAVIVDQLGKAKLEQYFSWHGWLFREQPVHDYGIDAHVEIVEKEKATGKIIAIQIKAGMSYFEEESDSAYVFRTDKRHVEYWTGHSLPVIVVLYHPEKDVLFWRSVSEETTQSTGKGWKINIPMASILTDDSIHELEKLIQPPTYIRRLNQLRLSRSWIDLVADGEKVYIEFEDWVNKSLPRFQFRIGCEGRRDIHERHWPTMYAPGLSFEALLSDLFPWADFDTDEDAVERDDDSLGPEVSLADDDDGSGDEAGESDVSVDWSDRIVPISSNGETDEYRVILTLNDLGKAFILLDDHLSEQDGLEERTFTLGE
jgi:hypothetical protein